MNVASDSLLHQSRSSLPELIGISSWEVAIADDATNVSASAIEYLTITSSLSGLAFARCDARRAQFKPHSISSRVPSVSKQTSSLAA
jgi:hypothetical protein